MPLSPQERELVTIGIAVACGCKTCLRENMLAARSLHVTDKDIADSVKIAVGVRMDAAHEVEKFISSGFSETAEPEPTITQQSNQRLVSLVSVGTAFAVNCAASLRKHLAIAKTAGIIHEDLHEVVGLSAFMKTVAASHVEQVMCPDEFDDETNALADYSMPFGPEHCAWSAHCKTMTEAGAGEMEQENSIGSRGKSHH